MLFFIILSSSQQELPGPWMHFLSQSFPARRILEAWLIISVFESWISSRKAVDCNKTKTECFAHTHTYDSIPFPLFYHHPNPNLKHSANYLCSLDLWILDLYYFFYYFLTSSLFCLTTPENYKALWEESMNCKIEWNTSYFIFQPYPFRQVLQS